MGFALWLDSETAWCAGTHEYRPMGAAVIAATGLFTARDFHRTRIPPSRETPSFQGLFASLVHVNAHLAQTRSQAKQIFFRPHTTRTKQIF